MIALRIRRPKSGLPDGANLPDQALEIRRMRPDLQQAFDVRTSEGRRRLFWWHLLNGFKELGLEVEPSAETVEAVNAPYPGLPVHGFLPISWLMRQLWVQNAGASRAVRSRSLLRRAWGFLRRTGSRLADAEEQQQLLDWYFTKALTANNLERFLLRSQARALLEDNPDHHGIPRLLAMIWREDVGLGKRFAGPNDPAFLTWCQTEGATAWPILAHPFVAIAPPPPSGRKAGFRAGLAFGVNLIGHARGRFGIGEDLRMAVLALRSAEIPFVIHNIDPSSGIKAEDTSLDHLLSDAMPYSLNLIAMSGLETVSVASTRKTTWREHYNIGVWPWELPAWPPILRNAYSYVDELWAPSQFTLTAYRGSATIPVHHQPVCVSTPETEGLGRTDFWLPEDRFLFAFSFDGFSTFTRKNPVACLRAFRSAFPHGDEPVGLVIKAMRVDDSAAWRALAAEIGDDPRIIIITDSLTRGRLLDLYRTIDCFVSLHRSEGFGRNIAECMALGKPVIVSATSGNMDFTTPDTAALVPVSLRRLQDHEYPFGAGQTWAEPDVAVAAALMRRMVEEPAWRHAIAAKGRAIVEAQYGPAHVGAIWAATLQQAHLLYCNRSRRA